LIAGGVEFGVIWAGRIRASAVAGLACAWVLPGGLVGCKGRGGGAIPPTWTRDVAPLIARRCGGCHGGDGHPARVPPALGSYEDARRSAGTVLLAIRRRMMPPFGADDTGLCGTWLDAPWLTDAEIATVGAWVEHGTPQGAPSTIRDAPDAPPHFEADRDHLVSVEAGAPFTPEVGERAYRCFVVEPRLAKATAITGLTVSSEPAAAVRQAALYELSGRDAVRWARQLDAADPGPGWSCYGAPAIDGAKLLASWSRNTPVQRLPAGTGVPLAREPPLVLQLRYDLIASAPGIPVRARMLLATGEVAHPAHFVALRPASFALPPAETQARVRATWTADHAATLWGLVPRMHTLGRVLDLERTHAGSDRQCLAHFGHWDVYDQQLFRSAVPVALAPGDQVALTCELATTSRQAATKMGEAPDDEQCLAHLYLVDAP
jgi:Copper type II ascorbate-dependent monooxygenase, C-terminal domain